MMNNKKKIVLLALVIWGNAGYPQFASRGIGSRADALYASGDYNAAAQYYKKMLDSKTANITTPYNVEKQGGQVSSSSNEANAALYWKLAESYRQLNNPTEAAGWYAKAISANTKEPLARFHYAFTLRATAKYNEAETELKQFINEYKPADAYAASAKKELENLSFIQSAINAPEKGLTAAKWPSVGTTSYAATYVANDVYYTSANAANSYTNDVYNNVEKGGAAGIPAEKGFHQGVASFTADGNTAYFTRWATNKEGKKESAIYVSHKEANVWTTPQKLGAEINPEGSNSRQPFISVDRKLLYFSSDREGGKGGFDIWFVPVTNDSIGKAVNTGTINTAGNDEAPFYHAGSGRLVFSTNGRTGMGGYDLFAAKGTAGSFAEPVNLGYPANSIKDDIYFTAYHDKGLLENTLISTDRGSACCLEIFALGKPYTKTVVARITDGAQPLPNASVTITDATGKVIGQKVTAADGAIAVDGLTTSEIKLSVTKDGYNPTSSIQPLNGTDTEELLQNKGDIALVPIPAPASQPTVVVENGKAVFHNILFAFNSATPDALSFEQLDAIVTYLKNNPATKAEIGAHTDGKGSVSYNLKLSQARASACVDYIVKAGIAKERLLAKGYGKSMPLEKEINTDGSDNEVARAANRRVEMTVQQ